jgi:hypothetical protein
MGAQVVVFTPDQDNPERGELKRFESLELAERFVESLLGQGVAQETLNVFTVSQIPLAVSYRPIVSLVAAESNGGSANEAAAEERPYEKDGERLSAALERPSDV